MAKFKLILKLNETEVFAYASEKDESQIIQNGKLALVLKDDKFKEIENIRFNNGVLENGKSKTEFKISTYTRLIDNKKTLINFNIYAR